MTGNNRDIPKNSYTSSIKAEYKNWLMEKVQNWLEPYGDALMLANELFNYDFHSPLPIDENREHDGIEMRFRFVEEQPGYNYRTAFTHLMGPCTVLEMMVGLASRMEDEILYDFESDRTGLWLFLMLKSMHLDKYLSNPEDFDRGDIGRAVVRLLDRNYEPNGDGGLFTIYNPREDLRDIDIWKQANFFITEYVNNY